MRALQGAVLVVLASGAAATVLPPPTGERLAQGVVAILIAAPILRVLWLTARWVRRRDWRFAGLGALLLAVVALGSALS